MKRTAVAATVFGAIVALAGIAAPAQTILYSFAALPGSVDTCKWFNDNLNTDRSIDALARQTDLLYNVMGLPAGAPVAVGGTATSARGSPLVDFKLGGKTVCTSSEAIYGPTPEPSASASPLPS